MGLFGLWYDSDRPPAENPVQDYSNWYKFAVPPDKVDELRKHVERATQEFGQKSIYFERAGEADFIENPPLRPPGGQIHGLHVSTSVLVYECQLGMPDPVRQEANSA